MIALGLFGKNLDWITIQKHKYKNEVNWKKKFKKE